MGRTDPGEKIRRRRSGFTMVELLVTFVVIGIAASIAIPAFSVWFPNYRLRSATRSIIGAIQLARVTAIKENCSTVIWFAPGVGTAGIYHAYVDDGAGGGIAGNYIQESGERTLIEGTMPVDVNLYNRVFSVSAERTGFNNRGLAQGGWGYVYLKNDKSRFQRVTVWTTGNLEIDVSTDGTTWS